METHMKVNGTLYPVDLGSAAQDATVQVVLAKRNIRRGNLTQDDYLAAHAAVVASVEDTPVEVAIEGTLYEVESWSQKLHVRAVRARSDAGLVACSSQVDYLESFDEAEYDAMVATRNGIAA